MEHQVEMFLRGGKFKNMIASQMAEICEKNGIKQIDTEILLYVSKCPKKDTASDIQKYLSINKGYLSQRLDDLCKKGYLRAVPDAGDRRYVHYPLEEKSRLLVEELDRNRKETNQKLFQGVSESDMKALERISIQIDKNIQRTLGEKMV